MYVHMQIHHTIPFLSSIWLQAKPFHHAHLSFLSATYASINSKSQTDVIYLDFTVSPTMNLLLVKLWSIGKTNNLYMVVVQSLYLSHRVQCVAINNHHSDFLPVLSGVPQGSILGPLLLSMTSLYQSLP